jgi:hypothetical protein
LVVLIAHLTLKHLKEQGALKARRTSVCCRNLVPPRSALASVWLDADTAPWNMHSTARLRGEDMP